MFFYCLLLILLSLHLSALDGAAVAVSLPFSTDRFTTFHIMLSLNFAILRELAVGTDRFSVVGGDKVFKIVLQEFVDIEDVAIVGGIAFGGVECKQFIPFDFLLTLGAGNNRVHALFDGVQASPECLT